MLIEDMCDECGTSGSLGIGISALLLLPPHSGRFPF
jgi:hypothetical protein